MAYGILKVDNIIFTNGGVDQTISVSGIVQSISGDITATGTIEGATIIGTSTVSGATVTGDAGVFTTVTGGSAGFTTVTGTTVTGTTADFASGVFTTQISGATVTGDIGSFTTLTGGVATITSGVFALGAANLPSISFSGDPNTGIYSPGADQLALSTSGTQRVQFDTGEVVFNDDGNNYDFRIEGDTVSNLFFVDASAGAVGIGTTSPTQLLSIAGSSANILLSGTSNSYTTYNINASNVGYVGDANWMFSGSSSDFGIRATSNLVFGIGASERARIDSSGNFYVVGAGTGGVNYAASFSGSAPVNSLNLDSSGRLLVGTSTARSTGTVTWLSQIEGGSLTGLGITTNANNTAGAYISLAKSRGTTLGSNTIVQNNDVLGAILFSGADGVDADSQAASIQCNVDGTPGANDMPGRLVFSTTADGASSPTERMRIDNAGQVGIGVSPSSGVRTAIKASSGGGQALTLLPGGAGDASVAQLNITKFNNDTTSSQYFVQFNIDNGAAASGRIVANGANQAAFASTSDIRLKENVQDLPSQLEKICSLRPVEFDYVESEGGGHQIGFIAQELQEIYPDSVSAGTDENQYLSVTGWSKTEARLVKALQEAVAKIESLEARLTAAGI